MSIQYSFQGMRNHGNCSTRTAAVGTLLIMLLWIGRGGVHAGPDLGQRDKETAGMRLSFLEAAASYAGGSGMIVRGEKTVFSWGDLNKRFDITSATQSTVIHANVKEMVQIGRLRLRRGQWHGQEALTGHFADHARKPFLSIPSRIDGMEGKRPIRVLSGHSGLLWWNNGAGTLNKIPKDAFFARGLHDSLIIVIPSLDIVIARAGKAIARKGSPGLRFISERFIQPVVASVNSGAPVPNSPVVSNVQWDAPATILRKAKGSDNWPLTWGSDDRLYTAYGDGRGFEPHTPKKLSLGFARVDGSPPIFSGTNIPSSDEQFGDGSKGKKASGMLMMNHILYMWVRNVTEAGTGTQLSWSNDNGKNWQWSNWIFKEFGGCSFINYGPNYQDARDTYVYSVSHDNPSAYERADQFILMRVPADAVARREAYSFFKGLDAVGKPLWTPNILERKAIFIDPGRCHRSAISYNASLGRYFWWQAKYPKETRAAYDSRSFGIFDAPEPWGPWSTVYFTENWDVATGESGSFPTKWISNTGRTMYLVFSGEDAFSVRKASLSLSPHSFPSIPVRAGDGSSATTGN